MRFVSLTAHLAPLIFISIAAPRSFAAPEARAADDHAVVRLSPGRANFSMNANGEWTLFGVRGERALVDRGGVTVFTTRSNGGLEERASASRGGMHAFLATGAIPPLSEGARGGARYPSMQPDDDNDGRVDEDAVDRIDNDGDGEVDEDFAAIGDEMVVGMYGTRGGDAVTIRQECYGWSLGHIDGMIASTIVIANAGTKAMSGVRIGIELEPSSGLERDTAPLIQGSRRNVELDAAFAEQQVVLRDRGRGLALLLLAPRSEIAAGTSDDRVTRATGWEINDDHSRLLVVSPSLGDLAPGAHTVIYLALVALPADDLKAARAIHNAHRTIVGDGTARFIPPPVSLTVRGDHLGGGGDGRQPVMSEGAADPFWNMSGKLEEKLLVGAPNPFHDVVTVDYEVPSRVVDEDGVEHVLGGSSLPTSVKVYNVAGRLVATLVDQPHSPGHYRTDWTARSTDGNAVASGVYYVKLQIGKRAVTMRMVQLK